MLVLDLERGTTANIQSLYLITSGMTQTLPSYLPLVNQDEPLNITSVLVLWQYILDQVVALLPGSITMDNGVDFILFQYRGLRGERSG